MGYLDLKRLFEAAIHVDESWDKGYFEYARCGRTEGAGDVMVSPPPFLGLAAPLHIDQGSLTTLTQVPRPAVRGRQEATDAVQGRQGAECVQAGGQVGRPQGAHGRAW